VRRKHRPVYHLIRGAGDMSDHELSPHDESYAEKFAQEVSKSRQSQHNAQHQFVISEKLKEQQAPAQWHQIRESLKRRVQLINSKLETPIIEWEGHRNFHATIKPVGSTVVVTAAFNESTFVIDVEGLNGPALKKMYVPDVRDGKFCFACFGKPVTNEDIVSFLVDMLKPYVK